ncbi:hypothetical protein AAVH_26845 [Aphelenchoides avenae]|nr:hypothetical protein AAVH_26845 [Aphelenchus avenae]
MHQRYVVLTLIVTHEFYAAPLFGFGKKSQNDEDQRLSSGSSDDGVTDMPMTTTTKKSRWSSMLKGALIGALGGGAVGYVTG